MLKDNPLTRPVPTEIPLKKAPLVKVIAQLRFPTMASLVKEDFIASFQEAVQDHYPVLRLEQSPVGKIWKFNNEQADWALSLSNDFIALNTSSYVSRSDFLERWGKVLTKANEHFHLKYYDRLGIRYIDRIANEAMTQVEKFIRPEALGIITHFAQNEMMHAMSEAVFQVDDSQLLARWGKLAAQSTIDPSAIEPRQDESWLLDIDMFTKKTASFDIDTLIQLSLFYTERIYSFFRWMVTDEFLKYYGGKL
ncbi:MAG: TIGR04255 family protein [Deltaproteobacteria bacterium]|nr:TIGR04255 family protein [Deltaproteobacteria bacterium]